MAQGRADNETTGFPDACRCLPAWPPACPSGCRRQRTARFQAFVSPSSEIAADNVVKGLDGVRRRFRHALDELLQLGAAHRIDRKPETGGSGHEFRVLKRLVESLTQRSNTLLRH